MIFARCSLTLLGILTLQSTGRADFLEANDEQTCEDLCTNCDGTAAFQDNVCQCYVTDDYQRGAECIGRIRRQAGELGLDVVTCDLADPDADRAARCIVSPFRRFRTQGDADLIAKYFMNGLGGLGGLLGSSKTKTGEAAVGSEKSDSSSGTGGDDAKTQSSDNNSDSGLVGAPNPSPMSGQLTGVNPLLSAAATWLNPQTLFAMGNGMQGMGGQSFVGQQSPTSMSSSTNQNHQTDSTSGNIVGSPHQDYGSSQSIVTQESHSMYPAGTMMGMAPHSYFLGAPNPAQLQDGSQGSPMQPYVYTYNSMVGAQNPYCSYPAPLAGMNNPQLGDPAAEVKSNADESVKATEELSESNPDSTLGIKKDTNFQDKINELETKSDEGKEPVVNSKQIHQNFKENAVNSEVEDQVGDTLNYSKKRRESRFKSKLSN